MATATTLNETTLYKARRARPELVEVPELLFAAVDGRGAPDDPMFAEAIGGLYSVAYGIRFALRRRGVDEKVAPLEALWSTPDPAHDLAAAMAAEGFSDDAKKRWTWTAMIRLPEVTDEALVATVRDDGKKRHPEQAGALDAVRLWRWREGLCVQTLHVGPYSEELATVRLMHEYMAENGYQPAGPHHEIYLTDPRRTAPERLRTILRHPVKPRP